MIEENEITHYDVLLPENEGWKHRLIEFIRTLKSKKNTDQLIKNYQTLDNELDFYLVFSVLVLNNELIAFSGMHSEPYEDSEARVLSRLYYAPSIRVKSLKGWTLPGYAVRFMLPHQIEAARRLNKSMVFLSMQGLRRRPFCLELTNAMRDYFSLPWTLEDGMYHTVRRNSNGGLNQKPGAWQNIISLALKPGHTLSLPHITCEAWEQKFGAKAF